MDNDVEESLELRLAVAEYNDAVDSLARLGYVTPDRFGYSTEDFRVREQRMIRAKAKMEELSARDYFQANPHRQ